MNENTINTMEEVKEVKEEAKEVKMTLRDFYEAIIAGAEITDEMKEIATKKIEQLDKKKEYNRTHKRSSKKSEANEVFKEAIVNFLSETQAPVKAKDIAAATGMSSQKVSALARQLVEDRRLVAGEEKIKGNRLVKTYAIAGAEVAE